MTYNNMTYNNMTYNNMTSNNMTNNNKTNNESAMAQTMGTGPKRLRRRMSAPSSSSSASSTSSSSSSSARRLGSSYSSSSASIFGQSFAKHSSGSGAGDCGRLIVKLKDTAAQGSGRRLKEDDTVGVKSWKALNNLGLELAEVDCSSVGSVNAALAAVKSKYSDDIEIAEVDQKAKLHSSAPVTDRWAALQWGMQRMRVDGAWERVAGSERQLKEIVVAVVDTGVEVYHPDLAGNMWMNPQEIPDNGIDDDNNGYVDDVYGWDVLNDAGSYEDPNGHGTHCAGVIAAAVNNTEGVVGIAGSPVVANVKLMAVAVFDANGDGHLSDALAGLNYALEQGATMSSHSWGIPETSMAFKAAVEAAFTVGHFIVAAAGNDHLDHSQSWNAHYPCDLQDENIVCVGSVGPGMEGGYQRSYFSDYSPEFVDIAAPGESILSTYLNGTYVYMDGTSMATPAVSGAIALVLSNFPHLTPREVKTMLLRSASHKEEFGDFVASGVLDVAAFVAAASGEPDDQWIRFYTEDMMLEDINNFSTMFDGEESRPLLLRLGDSRMRAGVYKTTLNVTVEGEEEDMDTMYNVRLAVMGGTDGVLTLENDGGFKLTAEGWRGAAVPGLGGSVYHTLALTSLGNSLGNASLEGLANSSDGSLSVQLYSRMFGEVNASAEGKLRYNFNNTNDALMIAVICQPKTSGVTQSKITIRTNFMLSEHEAMKDSALDEGMIYELPYLCVGERPPALVVEKPPTSGVKVSLDGAGYPIIVATPGAWNLFTGSGMISAPLVFANASGCNASFPTNVSGKIVLLEASNHTCSIAVQAGSLAAAGALGHIAFEQNNTPFENDFGSSKMIPQVAPGAPMPSIPSYQIFSTQGEMLRDALMAGTMAMANISWNPMLDGKPDEKITIPIEVSNKGDKAFAFRVMTTPAFNATIDDFYMPSPRPGVLTDPMMLLEMEDLADQDDAESNLTLPFPFALYWERVTDMWISTNGYMFWGDSPYSSRQVIAPAKADLVAGRIFAGPIMNGDAFVVQWRNMTDYYDMAKMHPFSFETRLYKDGGISFLYEFLGANMSIVEAFWISSSDAMVTIDPMMIENGTELYHSRWPVFVEASAEVLQPGESAEISVEVGANLSMQGIVAIESAYLDGSGGAYELLPLTWPDATACTFSSPGEWSECSAICPEGYTGPSTGAVTREVPCFFVETGAACGRTLCEANWFATKSEALPGYEESCDVECIGGTTTMDPMTTTLMTITSGEQTLSVSEVKTKQTLKSSLTLGGDEEPPQDTVNACLTGIKSALALGEDDDVYSTGVEQVTRRLRQLAAGWRVNYEIAFASSEDTTGGTGGTTATAALAKLQAFAADPKDLLAAVTVALEDAGISTSNFTLTAEEPQEIVTVQVAWVAEPWSSCSGGLDLACETNYTGSQTRTVWCALLEDGVPTLANATQCKGVSPLSGLRSCSGTTESCQTPSASSASPRHFFNFGLGPLFAGFVEGSSSGAVALALLAVAASFASWP
mmetsp:Transcript_39334/g.83802  ORF Transcript_39334/g.83802 Transcript_39334/m.83802 type:complete len:1501 (-) Transcript_39334:282-4784(-)